MLVAEQGRKIGAKTQRERDYIEAVAAYYEDWANRFEPDRQRSRAKAYEALAARYPDDTKRKSSTRSILPALSHRLNRPMQRN